MCTLYSRKMNRYYTTCSRELPKNGTVKVRIKMVQRSSISDSLATNG
jgi:hypothetical protein